MSLLEIKNLNVRFGDKTATPVVDGLDLKVDKGEVLAIVGESGSGKSVTMMALMGPDRASRHRHRRRAQL
ncbi:ABC-type glutathione transport system ATPase component [Pseudomonas monsensis]